MTSSVSGSGGSSNIYSASLLSIQNQIDAAKNNGDTATAAKLEAEASAMAAIYKAQKDFDEQVINDIENMAGRGSSDSNAKKDENPPGLPGSSSSSTSTSGSGGVFGLFQ